MKRIAFTTLGCKSNQYDTECLAEACRRAGFEVVESTEPADVYVINTCTVTGLADAQGRQLVRRTRRRSPNAVIIAVGCSVQNDEGTYRAMPEVDAVLGVRCVDALMSVLDRRGASDTPPPILRRGSVRSQSAPLEQSRARALLKIQDGCDRRCTYCAVWRARGPATSVEADDVLIPKSC
jgi:threonylcarbamoyladenosine tRNA methylthiotransferase MtaB